jgi:hypothetical protein
LQPSITRRPPDSTTFDLQIPRPVQSADDMGDQRARKDAAPITAEGGEREQTTPMAKLRKNDLTRSDEDIGVKPPERAMTPSVTVATPTPTGDNPDEGTPLTQAGGPEPQEEAESQK